MITHRLCSRVGTSVISRAVTASSQLLSRVERLIAQREGLALLDARLVLVSLPRARLCTVTSVIAGSIR